MQLFQAEISIHFAAEEEAAISGGATVSGTASPGRGTVQITSRCANRLPKLKPNDVGSPDFSAFAQRMSAHIRKEERQLFERLQELMNPEELALLGQAFG